MAFLMAIGMIYVPWRVALGVGVSIAIFSLAYAFAAVAALGWVYLILRSCGYGQTSSL